MAYLQTPLSQLQARQAGLCKWLYDGRGFLVADVPGNLEILERGYIRTCLKDCRLFAHLVSLD